MKNLLSGNINNMLLKIESLFKIYEPDEGIKISVLEDVNLDIKLNDDKAEIISLLSPFRGGKSTLLKMISGIENPTSGKIIYDDRIKSVPLITEKPSSFPWLNVKENVQYGIKLSKDNNILNAEHFISIAGLTGYENHYPHNKSFGFRFRISLARALPVFPRLILIDDSFKKMDSETKEEAYHLIKKIKNELNVTFIIATTNISEAILLSDKIYLLKKNIKDEFILSRSKIEQEGKMNPDEVRKIRREIEEKLFEQKIITTADFSI